MSSEREKKHLHIATEGIALLKPGETLSSFSFYTCALLIGIPADSGGDTARELPVAHSAPSFRFGNRSEALIWTIEQLTRRPAESGQKHKLLAYSNDFSDGTTNGYAMTWKEVAFLHDNQKTLLPYQHGRIYDIIDPGELSDLRAAFTNIDFVHRGLPFKDPHYGFDVLINHMSPNKLSLDFKQPHAKGEVYQTEVQL